jgi:hypothetical protein
MSRLKVGLRVKMADRHTLGGNPHKKNRKGGVKNKETELRRKIPSKNAEKTDKVKRVSKVVSRQKTRIQEFCSLILQSSSTGCFENFAGFEKVYCYTESFDSGDFGKISFFFNIQDIDLDVCLPTEVFVFREVCGKNRGIRRSFYLIDLQFWKALSIQLSEAKKNSVFTIRDISRLWTLAKSAICQNSLDIIRDFPFSSIEMVKEGKIIEKNWVNILKNSNLWETWIKGSWVEGKDYLELILFENCIDNFDKPYLEYKGLTSYHSKASYKPSKVNSFNFR